MQCRLVLCVNCNNWKVANNVELGTCELEQEGELHTNTTNYDTRCIYGLVEFFENDGSKAAFKDAKEVR